MRRLMIACAVTLCLSRGALAAPLVNDHVASFPVVVGGDPAAARINAALARATRSLRQAIDACHRDAAADGGSSGWTRTLSTTMASPAFLSIVTEDSAFCGGAYPNNETDALVYDRRTGSPVNWLRVLPPSFKAAGKTAGSLAGSPVGMVMSPPMLALYRKLYPARVPDVDDAGRQACLDSVEDGFILWSDGSRHALMIQPTASAHATEGCAVPVPLSPALLRSLGGDPRLADALADGR